MSIIKLDPFCRSIIWGGNRLRDEYGKKSDADNIAESWELSCHKDGVSIVASGDDEGMLFPDYIAKYGKEILGTNCERFDDFPILIKYIDAKDKLSVQVHPSDEFALKHDGQYGKTETWYIVDADEGAGIYYGMKKDLTKEEFENQIKDNTILDSLNFQKVRAGEMYFLEPGTIHAIGPGCLIAEIQQNSNVTYRVYDFGRRDANGNMRELHIEKAMQVANLKRQQYSYNFGSHLADCEYFTVDGVNVYGSAVYECDDTSFKVFNIIDGEGTMRLEETGETVEYKKGDCVFVTAGSGRVILCGKINGLLTYIS